MKNYFLLLLASMTLTAGAQTYTTPQQTEAFGNVVSSSPQVGRAVMLDAFKGYVHHLTDAQLANRVLLMQAAGTRTAVAGVLCIPVLPVAVGLCVASGRRARAMFIYQAEIQRRAQANNTNETT